MLCQLVGQVLRQKLPKGSFGFSEAESGQGRMGRSRNPGSTLLYHDDSDITKYCRQVSAESKSDSLTECQDEMMGEQTPAYGEGGAL